MSEIDCTISLKRCSKCGEEKPATLEYFAIRRNRPSGLQSRCRLCERLTDEERRRRDTDKRREQKQKRRKEDPEKYRAKEREYYARTHERRRELSRLNYANNAETYRGYARKYRAANPERYRQINRDRYSKHPEKAVVFNRRRRARKEQAIATFSLENERYALDYFNGCCAVCGRQLKDLFGTHTVHWDHWIPLSKGGNTTPDNMIPLCGGQNGCNNSKHDIEAEAWLNRKFDTRKAKLILKRIQSYFDSLKSSPLQVDALQ